MEKEEIRYNQEGEPHRTIAPVELVDLISQGRGLTAQTMSNILNTNVMQKLRRLLGNNSVSGKLMNGLTAGRPPLVITMLGQAPDIGFTTNMMTMGYAMWLLRRIGLRTGTVSLDANQKTLTTNAALETVDLLDSEDRVLQLKLMFWHSVLDQKIYVAQHSGCVPVVICKSLSQLVNAYEQLSEPAKALGVMGVVVRIQQNAKWLSAYLFTQEGIVRLTKFEQEKLNQTLEKIQLARHDVHEHANIMNAYEQSEKLALIHQPFLLKVGG